MAVFDPEYKHTGLDRIGNIEQYLVNANGGSQTAVILSTGPTDPTTLPSPVPSGDEYVWIKTDGSGNLIDIISGKVA